jgi:hypothetical protein
VDGDAEDDWDDDFAMELVSWGWRGCPTQDDVCCAVTN